MKSVRRVRYGRDTKAMRARIEDWCVHIFPGTTCTRSQMYIYTTIDSY